MYVQFALFLDKAALSYHGIAQSYYHGRSTCTRVLVLFEWTLHLLCYRICQ